MPASSPGCRSRIVTLEAVPLGPADVHAHEHLGPVLRLGAAGARMDGQEGIAAVVGAPQHGLELEAGQRVGEPLDLPARAPPPGPASGDSATSSAMARASASALLTRLRGLDPLRERSSAPGHVAWARS